MPQVIYPTSTEIRGPLLADSESLKNLDRIVAEQKPALDALRQKRIEQYATERELQARQEGMAENELERRKAGWMEYAEETVPEFSSELTVYFADATRLEANSFAEVLAHSEFSSTLAEGFEFAVECGAVKMSLIAESDSFDTAIKLKVSPSNAEGAKSLFADVRRWMRTLQPPLWQQWWCSLGHSKYLIWGPFVLIVMIALAYSIGGIDENYYKKQAQDLMQRGVSTSNQDKALEIILALESKAPAPTSHALGHWYWFFFIGTFLTALILSYPPKLVLGLGRGDDVIKYWKAWTKFVFVIVPTFVGSNFLWPYVSELAKKWFGLGRWNQSSTPRELPYRG